MKNPSAWYAVVAALAWLLSAYRAATQSVVHDEAFTYLRFVSGPWSGIFKDYDANNHVLFSLLAKASVVLFGLTELTLRLPTLVAWAALLWALALECRRVWPPITRLTPGAPDVDGERSGAAWLGVVAFAAIVGNPMLLDYAAAARGYVLGLALLLWGLRWAREGRHLLTGVAFGLAVAANLTLAVPAAALGLVFLRDWRRLWVAGSVGITVAASLVAGGLLKAQPDPFYYGARSMAEWAEGFVRPLLRHEADVGGPLGTEWAITAFIWALGPLLVWLAWRRRPLGVAVAICVLVLMAAHLGRGVPYPLDRTGLYFVPLLLLAVFESAPARVSLVVAALLTAQNLTQLGTRHFVVWEYDAASRPVLEAVCAAARAEARPGARVRVWWTYQPALEYYRRALCPGRIRPIEREPELKLEGADFYVLSESSPLALPEGHRIVYQARPPGVVAVALR